ncbi:MAG: PTS sugar transporter subunit IIA, partial [Candidatus Hydrogenedentes bacterium]|nr:PTS sugar transporter subunit IIA [Candidatus Hydrogenedentota bacterium]
SREGIDFASLDGRPCHLVFLVLAPPGASTRYLDALSSIASIGVRPDDVTNLAACTSAQQVLDRLAEMNGARNPTGLQYSFLR